MDSGRKFGKAVDDIGAAAQKTGAVADKLGAVLPHDFWRSIAQFAISYRCTRQTSYCPGRAEGRANIGTIFKGPQDFKRASRRPSRERGCARLHHRVSQLAMASHAAYTTVVFQVDEPLGADLNGWIGDLLGMAVARVGHRRRQAA